MTALFGFDLTEFQFLLGEGEQLDPALLAAGQGMAWVLGHVFALWPALATGTVVAALVLVAAHLLARSGTAKPTALPATPARTAQRMRPLAFPGHSAHYQRRRTAQGTPHGQGRDA